MKKFVLILISSLFAVLFLEIFSRNFIEKVPSKIFHFNMDALVFDQDSLNVTWKKPSKSIMTNGHFKEYVIINKDGFRVNSVEEEIFNPQIITIGDSQTFGHGISNDDTWPSLLEKSTGLSLGNLGFWGYRMQNYDYQIINLVKNYKPKYLVYGMTDNDLCSFETSFTKETEYKRFLSMKKQTHLQIMLKEPFVYFKSYTSLGRITRGSYFNVFYRNPLGISLRSKIRKKSSRNLDVECTIPTIKWLTKKALFLKKHNIEMIVLNIPNSIRVINAAKGFDQKNYMKSIASIKKHKNNSLYYFIDPITELSEHYKNNNYKRDSIILPVDGHNNRFSNNILANLVKKKINKLELLKGL